MMLYPSQWRARVANIHGHEAWMDPTTEYFFCMDVNASTIVRSFRVADLFINSASTTTKAWHQPAIWVPCDIDAGELGFATAINVKEMERAVIDARMISNNYQNDVEHVRTLREQATRYGNGG